jgi:transposase InsO family protein
LAGRRFVLDAGGQPFGTSRSRFCRVTADLRRAGEAVNHKKIQRLMKTLGLKSLVRRKKYRSYRGDVARVAPNLLARKFSAAAPNSKRVTDVTEFGVNGQKLYLSRSWICTTRLWPMK